MKKIVGLMAIGFLLIACKTKQVTTHQQEQKTDLAHRLIQQEGSTQKSSVSSEELERQTQLMTELIAKINLAFSGKSKDDKLLFELKRTLDGLVLQVSGTGEATYQQDEKINIEALEQRLYKHQDSVLTSVKTEISDLKIMIDHYFKTKDKEVKTKDFSFGGYLSLILWILLLVVLMFLAWRLKLFRKITAIITKFKRFLKMI